MKSKIISFFMLLSVLFFSCHDELKKADYDFVPDQSKAPTVLSEDPIIVSGSYAILKGTVTEPANADDPLNAILDQGILISEDPNVASDIVLFRGNVGTFEILVSDLKGQTRYYYRTFATNHSGGTALGEIKSFTTFASQTLFNVNFRESSMEDWQNAGFTTIDKDGDGQDWHLAWFSQANQQISYRSFSWNGGELEPENYLLLPEITIEGGGIIGFTVQAADASYPREKFKLVISDEPITEENCRDAEVLFSHELANGNEYSNSVMIPPKYGGGNVYIAFAHYDCTDWYALFLKAISVRN